MFDRLITTEHSLASIHPNAKLGKGVVIDPFSVIHDNVEIGEGTWIASNVTVFPGARIGKNCKIFPGAVIAAVPQDLKFRGEETTAEIGDYSVIRECVTINRGTSDRQTTRVGSNCLLMAYSHVAHDCLVGNHVILANLATLAGHITVEDHVILEGFVAVQQFITVGAHSFVAGGSLVRKDVPPFVKAAKEPLSYAGVNVVGLRRRGFSEDVVRRIEDIYRIIYVRGYNMNKALEMVVSDVKDSPEKNQIIEFIRKSEYGVIKGMID